MELEDLTGQIIGCAFRVFNTMGHGFVESVYEGCLEIELKSIGFVVERQKAILVSYQGIPVGDFVGDLVVNGRVIVELKAVRQLIPIHEVQLVNYLKATGIEVGLLLNFGETKVEVKRKLRHLPPADINDD